MVNTILKVVGGYCAAEHHYQAARPITDAAIWHYYRVKIMASVVEEPTRNL